VEGGTTAEGGGRVESFGGAFSDIVASDKGSRSVLLARGATEREPQEFVLIGIDDGRILDRVSMPPLASSAAREWLDQPGAQQFLEHLGAMVRRVAGRRVRLEPTIGATGPCYVPTSDGHALAPDACADDNPKPPFATTRKPTPTWEPDGTYDVCFFLRSGGRSKKVDCLGAVTTWTSRCDGGVCTLFGNSNSGPVVLTLVDERSGDVFGSGSLLSPRLDDVVTQGMRVALRFYLSQAVVDLGAREVFERIPVPDETGEVHPSPLAWYGDDTLLSCEIDSHADRRRPCQRLAILPLADATKWRMASESIRFEFATQRRAKR
jgi:hypothetical protein